MYEYGTMYCAYEPAGRRWVSRDAWVIRFLGSCFGRAAVTATAVKTVAQLASEYVSM